MIEAEQRRQSVAAARRKAGTGGSGLGIVMKLCVQMWRPSSRSWRRFIHAREAGSFRITVFFVPYCRSHVARHCRHDHRHLQPHSLLCYCALQEPPGASRARASAQCSIQSWLAAGLPAPQHHRHLLQQSPLLQRRHRWRVNMSIRAPSAAAL